MRFAAEQIGRINLCLPASFSKAQTHRRTGGELQRCAFSTQQRLRKATHDLHDIQRISTEHRTIAIRSTSNNVYHNLAIENYLLRNAHSESRVFFSYVNEPCVVIGRNQNPWLECNLRKIQDGLDGKRVDLVRRRSGGGTVIHDAGNLNFSFIVPNDKHFDRKTHAQLVVEALKEQGSKREKGLVSLYRTVRVNERHDIVMRRAVPTTGSADDQEYKCSGSAFKLTRGRALHHGTLLLSSPNLQPARDTKQGPGVFSSLLSSPAAPYLEAKGVGSVRSPVHNLFELAQDGSLERLVQSVVQGISQLFRGKYPMSTALEFTVGDDDCTKAANAEIWADAQELMSDEWRYCQTPSFDYTSIQSEHQSLALHVKQGVIKKAELQSTDRRVSLDFLGERKLHEIQDWEDIQATSMLDVSPLLLDHLSTVFPRVERYHKVEAPVRDANIIEEAEVRTTQHKGQISRQDLRTGVKETEVQDQNTVVQH